MKASTTMLIVTSGLLVTALLLAVWAGALGSLDARDAFVRTAAAVGGGGLTLTALFALVECCGASALEQHRPGAGRTTLRHVEPRHTVKGVR
jgi:hypothetical protein